jgi:hypothetical protein
MSSSNEENRAPETYLRYQDAAVICIDVEGLEGNLLEIAALTSTEEGVSSAINIHVIPQDEQAVYKEAPYCHGIDPKELKKNRAVYAIPSYIPVASLGVGAERRMCYHFGGQSARF